MKRLRVILAFILSAAMAASADEPKQLMIDLKDGGNVVWQVAPGEYEIRIINMLPGKQYNITTAVRPIVEAPVSIAEAKKATTTTTSGGTTDGTPAPEVRTVPDNCNDVLDEATTTADAPELATHIAEGRNCGLDDADIRAACVHLLNLAKKHFTDASTAAEQNTAIKDIRAWGNTSGCPDVRQYAETQCAELLKTAKTAIAKADSEATLGVITVPLRVLRDACGNIDTYLDVIEQVHGPVTVGRAEMLTITIVRKDNSVTWERSFSTGKRGEWLTGYGILFVPNRDANYSSYSLGNDHYEIRRSRDREKFDYVPTLTFTFMRPKDAPRSWFVSPVFGLGYDLQTISGTVGYAATYNHNFAISAGVMLHQQRRLKGKYEEGEHYTKTGNVLENNDLTETTWAPNVFIGITIRSLTNPFAR